MPVTDAGKNIALDDLGASATHVALFNGDPSGAGTEISGGTYARQSVTWNAASAGNLDSSNAPTFDVPAGATVNHIAIYTAATGGTLLAYRSVTAETFSSAGTYTVTDLDISLT